MSELTDLLEQIRQQQIKIWIEGDKIRYRASKGKVTNALLALLKQHKADLIVHLKDIENAALLQPIPDQADYALSAAQQRLWLLAQMDEDSSAYTIPLHLALTGSLNIVALEQALCHLIQRHESLHTCFINIDGEPRQKILPISHFKLDTIELETEQQVHNILSQLNQQPFDLQSGPLFTTRLLELTKHRHVLCITMHHIISDGWSISVIIKELWQCYHSFCNNSTINLAPLSIQYRDFAAWQNLQLASEAIAVDRKYWLKHLAGEIPLLDLPTDFPRPQQQSFNGHEISFSLDLLDSKQIQQFCQQQRVSLFMLLQAIITVLSYRYSKQTDIIFGSPIAGRNAIELENQIGFYINTLVLRHRFEPDQPFSDFLQQVRRTTTDAYDHQNYPFDHLVNELNLQRDLSRSPLFDMMIILQNASGEIANEIDGLTIEPITQPVQTSKLDITWHFHDDKKNLHFSIEYNCDLFKQTRIERMAEHFNQLMQSVLANPEQSIITLNILSELERKRLLTDFNSTAAKIPPKQTLIDLFITQAKATPYATAVSFNGNTLTYQQLDQLSNALAKQLAVSGVNIGDRVAVCIERSEKIPLALLAVLKSGAAYVPLDPTYPPQRLNHMVDDTQIKAVLTQTQLDPLTDAWLLNRSLPRIYLDQPISAIDDIFEPMSMPRTDSLAYIIYTSGSTGIPKGVAITHHNLINFVSAMQSLFHLSEKDKLLAVTTLSFDIAALEIFCPLLCGAEVVILSQEQAGDGIAIAKAITDQGISIMQATPTTWRLLLATDWQGSSQLKILCGGEVLPMPLAKQLKSKAKEVWNLYGPTETTVWSSAYRLPSSDLQLDNTAVGRPIANTLIYILNSALQPVPIGVAGELYIGGEGLSPGYWQQPELSSEKFITNPFKANGLIYRSGDLARFNEDGIIEYLGRIDQQIKLRGFRIELGEIEVALSTHPTLAVAIAKLHNDNDSTQLLAYYTVNSGLTVTVSELREYLSSRLPTYMLPEAYIAVTEFPLTPNGKIDRNALPHPNVQRPELINYYLAPRTELEQKIASAWQNILAIEKIGVHDNFFELGGHSLKATRLISTLMREQGLQFKLAEIFQNPSIAQLAVLASTRSTTNHTEITALSADEWALLAADDD